MKCGKSKLLIFFFLISAILWPAFSWAKAYDFYVDTNYKGEKKEGSKDNPFVSIQDAIKASLNNSKKERNILIKKGEYDEEVVLEDSVKLYGDDKGKVVFKKTAKMKNNTLLSNIIISNVKNGVWVEAGANASILGCEIKDFKGTGIWTEIGSGKLTVKNTKISDGTGKGLYIQEGKEIYISDSTIFQNGEEGLDVRARVTGKVKNNKINRNKESGIEFIIGSANLSIENNSIEANGSSAIASQFYQDTKNIGKISIIKNVLSDSRKYGLDCLAPHNSLPYRSYWSQSMTLSGNLIEGNGIDPISKVCFVNNIIEEQKEKQDNKILDSNISQEEEAKNAAEAANQSSAAEVIVSEETELGEELKQSEENLAAIIETLEESERKIENRNFLIAFLIGPNFGEIRKVKINLESLNENREKVSELLSRSQLDENQARARKMLENMEEKETYGQKMIEEKENLFSLFGWVVKCLI